MLLSHCVRHAESDISDNLATISHTLWHFVHNRVALHLVLA
jgi:hypothetical protein